MSDREQSTNVPGVYRDLRRNTRETTGKYINNIITFTFRAIECTRKVKVEVLYPIQLRLLGLY